MAYKSKYDELLDSALGKMTNREKFSYDFNADPMYQTLKDRYTKAGNEAAMNAAANVSALTGGYGNSYATTAAAQANQQHLDKLNDRTMELYEAALNKYMMEGDQLKDAYSAYSDAANRDYSKHRDDVADEQWQQNFDYGKERDAVSDARWQQDFDYNKERAAVADDQWQKSFDYSKERNAVADDQWKQSFDQTAKQLEESIRQYNENFNYNKSRDAVADAQWKQNFDENKRRYDQEWAASQNAQAAAQALASSRAATTTTKEDTTKTNTQNNQLSKKGSEMRGYIRTKINEYKKAPDANTAATYVGRMLDSLVKQNQITENDADLYYEAYMKNKL